jgi:hypothetical protein
MEVHLIHGSARPCVDRDAVSSTKNSLDILQRFSLTSRESFSTSRLLYAAGGGDSPSSRSVATLGARSLGALELGPVGDGGVHGEPGLRLEAYIAASCYKLG